MLAIIWRLHQNKTLVGILLMLATVLALSLENSSFRHDFHHLIEMPIDLFAYSPLSFTVHELVNEGLLTIFFFLVGLEVKYEIVAGNLRTLDKLLHPAVAAIGGVIVPAMIYLLFNMGMSDTQVGWAIPTATDIAFAVGVLSLVGERVPALLKTLLVTIAIFDDLIAILIIALFYSEPIVMPPLYCAVVATIAMRLVARQGVRSLLAYILPAFVLWAGVLYSGIHATISGFIIALCLPTYQITSKKWNTKLLYQKLEPWVNYGILPIFALANAGVYLLDIDQSDLINPVSRGIMLGLLLGKPLGISLCSTLYLRLCKTQMTNVSTLSFVGMGFLCGIGFTMSLFIGNLAFGDVNPEYVKWVKIGVLRGSFLSGLVGLTLLYFQKNPETTEEKPL